MAHSWFAAIAVLIAMALSAGCAAPSQKAVYKKSQPAAPLEVPPDLAQPKGGAALEIPTARAESAAASAAAQPVVGAVPAIGFEVPGVRLVRDGRWRWLEIDAEPGVVWVRVSEFLLNEGFLLERQDAKLGVIETNWLDNYANEPSNAFSRAMGKVFATGLRDKYRVRIEAAPEPGKSYLYLTHQGMIQEATGGGTDIVSTYWTWRDSDPEIEAEMLQRFIVSLGTSPAAAAEVLAAKPAPPRATLLEAQGRYSLRVNDDFARTWRQTEIALDRIGAQIEDRDRERGVVYIKVPDTLAQEQGEQGWFKSLFGGGDEERQHEQYQLQLTDIGDATLLSVHDKDGQRVDSPLAQRLLRMLEQNLR